VSPNSDTIQLTVENPGSSAGGLVIIVVVMSVIVAFAGLAIGALVGYSISVQNPDMHFAFVNPFSRKRSSSVSSKPQQLEFSDSAPGTPQVSRTRTMSSSGEVPGAGGEVTKRAPFVGVTDSPDVSAIRRGAKLDDTRT